MFARIWLSVQGFDNLIYHDNITIIYHDNQNYEGSYAPKSYFKFCFEDPVYFIDPIE